MACGEKQRRPADAHCACVGGVVLVLIWTKSLTTGCMTTPAAAGTMAVPGKARTEPATPATRRRKPRVRNLTISTPPVHGRFMDARLATLKRRRERLAAVGRAAQAGHFLVAQARRRP